MSVDLSGAHGQPADPIRRVVVIGGGVAGLVTALDLAKAGLQPLVLEAAEATGGVVSSHRVGGVTLDAGAESFATSRPAVADLLNELGLAAQITRPNPVGAWVRHQGGSAPLPANGFLGIPGRPWAADVRHVIGLAGALRAAVDTVLPTRSTLPANATLGALVRTRMGRRVLDRLVEPVAGGVYAADPNTLDIAAIAPALPNALATSGSLAGAARTLRGGNERPGSAVATLAGGLHTFVQPLVRAVEAAGGTVRTKVAVQALARDDAGWRVETTGGEPVQAAAVVVALPAPQAADLLETAVPEVPCRVLRSPITSVLICTLVVDDQRLDAAPRGTGILVASRAAGVRAKALTHATAKWPWLATEVGPGRHVLRLSYGRNSGPDDRPDNSPDNLPDDDQVGSIALGDASELLGVPLSSRSVVDTAVIRWPTALPAPRPGHADAAGSLRASLRTHNMFIAGAAVAGSGLAAVVADARITAASVIEHHGAVSSIASPAALDRNGSMPR